MTMIVIMTKVSKLMFLSDPVETTPYRLEVQQRQLKEIEAKLWQVRRQPAKLEGDDGGGESRQKSSIVDDSGIL